MKAFKFRIHPNQEQQKALQVQFDAARFVYNFYRAAREGYYQDTGKGLNYFDTAEHLADILKVDNPWLKQADAQVLQQKLKDLDGAYQRFFKGLAKYPNFKKKNSKQSIRYPQRFKLEEGKIYLPKVGWVKIVEHREVVGSMKNVTVSKTSTGKYFASIVTDAEVERNDNNTSIGIDLGLTTFATLSDGRKIDNPKFLKKSERRLKIRQRRLSRKKKGSNNRNKARKRVALVHEKITNQRKDFHHQVSRLLVNEFDTIAVESLNISGMVKSHNLSKAITDAGWNQFLGFVEYKATQVLKVDRFFPSSKTCSACGEKKKHLPLNIRQWTCLSCGVIHDRDVNAAINILSQTTVGITESNACGNKNDVSCSAQEAQYL